VKGKLANGMGKTVHFTLPRNMVYPALLPLMRTSRLPVVDRTDGPYGFKRTRPFRRKTKSGFCACAITFQTQSNSIAHSFRMSLKNFSQVHDVYMQCETVISQCPSRAAVYSGGSV